MNTTILFRPRQSGKTTELVRIATERHNNEQVLFLVATGNQMKNLKDAHARITTYRNIKIASYHPKAIQQSLRGYTPEVVIIDSADYLTTEAIKEIRMLLPRAKELYMAGSNSALLKFKVPELLLG